MAPLFISMFRLSRPMPLVAALLPTDRSTLSQGHSCWPSLSSYTTALSFTARTFAESLNTMPRFVYSSISTLQASESVAPAILFIISTTVTFTPTEAK